MFTSSVSDVPLVMFVESEDLERTWKAERRERLKHQEQKIWEEFVKEQDIVHSLCKDDPYQFVERLPQECIKELLDSELQKMRQEKIEELELKEQPAVQVEPPNNQHVVTFVEDSEEDINTYDDEKDDDDVSGPEDELLNDSMSPPLTVRERDVPSPDKISTDGKSSNENVSDVIEGSIYCAKIKDLRMKIIDELNNIMSTLSLVPVLDIDPAALPGAMKRAKEFSSRYQRIHLYQLQRQISDIERNNSKALPFAARTHFQAQLCRVASVHSNLLHALQVFVKAVPQTACVCECVSVLRGVSSAARQVTVASEAARPRGLGAADTLYIDAMDETCGKLMETLDEYEAKVTDYMHSTVDTSVSMTRKSRVSKKSVGSWTRSGRSLLSAAEARLSMYSLDTRFTLHKSTSSREHSSGTSRQQASIGAKGKQVAEKETQNKTPKKLTSGRRPLMRAPSSLPRPRVPRDQDVPTMVETVACASSHISNEGSPMLSPGSRNTTPRRISRETTPRVRLYSNRIVGENTKHNRKGETGGKDTSRSLSEPKTEGRRQAEHTPTSDRRSPAREMKDVKQETGERERCPTGHVEVGSSREDAKETERTKREEERMTKSPEHQVAPANLEVTRLLRQLCGGDGAGSRNERVSGTKNAQLLCISGGSPRQHSTPQLLRILEETIQKKAPKTLFPKSLSARDKDRYRMTFNIPDSTLDNMFQYRTKFVQHMLTSPMYANSSVGKPWEKIGRVSEQIIDDLLLSCAKEMELQSFLKDLYKSETS
ncbi:uncharacterized protein LOC116770256 isoform X2 [Danaus plexippus]|uniref:uncharacterized protein LOC116770256 isoform X2 n=1 Tax=Danaus plexippus TaxID=13037 RepID=UPI002AB09950|nr:uncharacterized protein LOC116770256 isoform X2 [Danaus plexippus]